MSWAMLRFSCLVREIKWVPDARPKHELDAKGRKAVVGKGRLEED